MRKSAFARKMNTVPERSPSIKGVGLLQACGATQPRAVRIFSAEFDVLWDNRENREERYPVYRDTPRRVVSIPQEGSARKAWPVYRAFSEHRIVKRDYRVKCTRPQTDHYFHVRAWLLKDESNGRTLAVEEVERSDESLCYDERVTLLDTQLSDLTCRVTDVIAEAVYPNFFCFRLESRHLEPCQWCAKLWRGRGYASRQI